MPESLMGDGQLFIGIQEEEDVKFWKDGRGPPWPELELMES